LHPAIATNTRIKAVFIIVNFLITV